MHVLVDVTYETILSMPRDCELADENVMVCLIDITQLTLQNRPGATLPVSTGAV